MINENRDEKLIQESENRSKLMMYVSLYFIKEFHRKTKEGGKRKFGEAFKTSAFKI